jgi:hypothetical protein
MQSTAIDDTQLENVGKTMKNVLVNDDTVQPKSPRNNAAKTNGTCSLQTPRAKRANYKDLDSDQENESINDKPQTQRKLRSSKRGKK